MEQMLLNILQTLDSNIDILVSDDGLEIILHKYFDHALITS